MNKKNHTEVIAQYLAGDLSPQEEKELMTWVEADANNQTMFDEMVKLWSFTGEHSPEIKVDTAEAWSKLALKLEGKQANRSKSEEFDTSVTKTKIVGKSVEKPNVKVVSINKWTPLLRIAAIALLVFGAAFWYMNKGGSEVTSQILLAQTMNDERKEVILPDGSTVWLNQNSSLTYDKGFEPRTVALKGEGFFDVKKMDGKLFEIISGDAKTTVLGTSFNVRAYPNEGTVEVTVETGKVALEYKSKAYDRVLLVAGESGSFDKPKQVVAKVDTKISNANAWRTRELAFSEDIPLSEILNDMERYFGITIKAKPEIQRCTFTSGTTKNPVAKDILDAMVYGLNLKLEKTSTGYQLSGEGCR